MQQFKRHGCRIIFLVLILLSLPVSTFAQTDEEVVPAQTEELSFQLYLPFAAVQWFAQQANHIHEPIGAEGKTLVYRQVGANVIDCFTHPGFHCRVWFGTTTNPFPTGLCDPLKEGTIVDVSYWFSDEAGDENDVFTHLPNYEVGIDTPIASWIWSVEHFDRLGQLVQWLKDNGQENMAQIVTNLAMQNLSEGVVQLNGRHGLFLGVPTSKEGLLGNEDKFVLECYQ